MNREHAYIKNGTISNDNIAFYAEYGFLVAPELLSKNEIDGLKKETAAIFRGERGHVDGILPVEENEDDKDILKKYVAIHFPHKISPVIHSTLFHKKIVD